MIVVPDSFSRANLTYLAGVGNPLHGAVIRLYKNNVTPTRASALGDFDEADFDGYTASTAVVFAGPYTDPLLGPYLLGDLKTFLSSGGVTPNTIYGWILDNGGVYCCGELFPASITVAAAGVVIPVLATFGEVSQSS